MPRRPRTTLAFLLSPGIAALAGAIFWAAWWLLLAAPAAKVSIVDFVAVVLFWVFCLAFGGYITAFFIAVPLYMMLPERVRRTAWIVVPLAGASAAIPWIWFYGISNVTALPIGGIFGLGCIAGIAFLAIRRASASDDLGQDD